MLIRWNVKFAKHLFMFRVLRNFRTMESFSVTFSTTSHATNAVGLRTKSLRDESFSGERELLDFTRFSYQLTLFRVMVIVIALHNLSVQSPGLSKNGHFHFSTHITNFIEKNWQKFFPDDSKRRKRKNILGTIAGALSQKTDTFVSGTETIGSIGWWKLSKKWTPREFEKFYQNRVKRTLTSDDDEMETKRIKLNDMKLENCCHDTEDKLLKELNQLKEELAESCSGKVTEEAEVMTEIKKKVKLEMMTQGEEEEMYKNLKKIIETEDSHKTDVPSWIRRYYRKLCVRKQKQLKLEHPKTEKAKNEPTFLDRFFTSYQQQSSLLAGSTSHDLFQSPYTGQTLHPFIYRDKNIQPKWLKLMCEMKFTVNKIPPERSSIDYCYAKPQHISAINSLLQQTFWPGIDMTESLSYPDFTVVALYKKLVIGCAFLVPDVCHNEAYISFLAVRPGWDRCGIASFMLYHLTQTSHGKDVTLHVSASNPAICLYQKFGFKTEELVLDFYEKFLPPDSPQSPHALFLRLTR